MTDCWGIFYKGFSLVTKSGFEKKTISKSENFLDLLIDNKLNIVETIKFPDHHIYSDEEFENLINKIKDNNYILLTTEKDYFRISENHKKYIKCLKIKVEIENKNQFIEEIKKVI